MADGFWKRLFNSTCKEESERELSAAEAEDLKRDGYVRKHFYLSGCVQGVGLRYTAFYLCGEMGLTGWVANLDDGRVELEVQGRAEVLDRLPGLLDGRGRISISGIEEEERPLLDERCFRVRG